MNDNEVKQGKKLFAIFKKAQSGSADAQFLIGLNFLEGRNFRKNTRYAYKYFWLASQQKHAQAEKFLNLLEASDKEKIKDLILQSSFVKEVNQTANEIERETLENVENDLKNVQAKINDTSSEMPEKAEGKKDKSYNVYLLIFFIFFVVFFSVRNQIEEYKGVPSSQTMQYTINQRQTSQKNIEKSEMSSIEQFNQGKYWYLQNNVSNAMAWYEKSANQGLSSAQLALAFHYMIGGDVQRNPSQAIFWLRKAVRQKNASAQYLLKLIFEEFSKPEDSVECMEMAAILACQDGVAEGCAIKEILRESNHRN